ncbi:hypothetical protein [Parapedobacter koreensis]|uniref:TonB dependent receptor n=1 Tax=Parapedobacter koreensis TaxID=332977 RepID=A0A1H7MRB1_9SPHI|nr:hypothetical protein [Parapedobacter koreensis]SEL13724.1 hypothetical protein SAMN05421740_103616 [Parapedobacter koreensis]
MGNSIPAHYFGLNLQVSYGAFDFSANLQGIAGAYLFNGFYRLRTGSGLGNKDAYILNRWRSEAEPGNGIQPRAVIGDPAQNNRPSTLMLEKSDYLKVRQLSVGYLFPEKLTAKWGIPTLRIYCSTNNLFTFTKYSQGFDPDIAGYNNNNLARGIDDLATTPNPRSVVLGLKLNL